MVENNKDPLCFVVCVVCCSLERETGIKNINQKHKTCNKKIDNLFLIITITNFDFLQLFFICLV